MLVDYNLQKQFTKSLDIVDAGNVSLRCEGDKGEYYMIVNTRAGFTAFLTYGPVLIDSKKILADFKLEYKVLKYDMKRIYKTIDNFINESVKKIEEAVIITELEALEALPDIKETYKLD